MHMAILPVSPQQYTTATGGCVRFISILQKAAVTYYLVLQYQTAPGPIQTTWTSKEILSRFL